MVTEQPPGWLAGKPEYLPKAEDHGGVGKNKGREEHDGRFHFWEAGMTKEVHELLGVPEPERDDAAFSQGSSIKKFPTRRLAPELIFVREKTCH